MYKIEKMTQDIALHIADDWKYPDEYSFYDMTEDPEDYAEIVSEDLRGDRYYLVFENNILIGYFYFYEEDEFVSYMRVEISSNTTIEFRLATLSDLDNIKRKYKEIVEKILRFLRRYALLNDTWGWLCRKKHLR